MTPTIDTEVHEEWPLDGVRLSFNLKDDASLLTHFCCL
jgi:hypothetical protein